MNVTNIAFSPDYYKFLNFVPNVIDLDTFR